MSKYTHIGKNSGIPFEVRMKYIIKDYKQTLDKMEVLKSHAKALEARLAENNRQSSVIKELRQENQKLKQQLEAYPRLKKKVMELKTQVRYYQRLLEDNCIVYLPIKDTDDISDKQS